MIARPRSLDEACEIVRSCAQAQRSIGVATGDEVSGPAGVPVDDVISMREMNRIVEYAPADQVVTVEAGMPVGELQAVLRERNQRLALDPPQPERTSVGATVAGNRYGALRTRYGTAKDVIVGMTIVRADGTRARGGGKVVKNVAGFDIPKLMVGTYGTLALIGTVTFRLHPLPHANAAVVVEGIEIARVRALVSAILQAQLEPAVIVAAFDGQSYRLQVTFEGFEAGVRAQRNRFTALAGSAREGRDADAEHDASRWGDVALKISAPVSQLESLHASAILPLYRALNNPHACIYPSAGVAFVSGEPGDEAALLSVLAAARAWAESAGGALLVESAPHSLRAPFDPWGTPPPAFALMRALKARFDPERLLLPGGFVGGL